MIDKEGLGNRMKEYEKQESGRRFLARLPIIARLDGKGFSKFTKGMKRPYDQRLSSLMISTAQYLVEQSGACCAYTQSDEISLLFYSSDKKYPVFFDRKIQKINSVLASMTTAYFNHHKESALPEKHKELALFDSRVWTMPTQEEAANLFLWRERDATKNSISMATREHYSHEELLSKNSKEMQSMLLRKDINWNDYPAFFKRGTFVQRQDKAIGPIDMPPFGTVTNPVEVLFRGAVPTTK